MEYNLTISQRAIALNFPGLDIKDAGIIDFLGRYSHSNGIHKKAIGTKIFYWFNYDKIAHENPLLKLGEEAIRKRLREFCRLEILEAHPGNSGSSKVFFAFGSKYELTHRYEPREENPDLLGETSGRKSRAPREENPDLLSKPREENPDISLIPKGYHKNQYHEDQFEGLPAYESYLIEIHEPVKKEVLQLKTSKARLASAELLERVIAFLNAKTGSCYKTSTDPTKRAVLARIKEGWTEEKFKLVIDFKTAQWAEDDKMKEYLRPATLFSPKFESYLIAAQKWENTGRPSFKKTTGSLQPFGSSPDKFKEKQKF